MFLLKPYGGVSEFWENAYVKTRKTKCAPVAISDYFVNNGRRFHMVTSGAESRKNPGGAICARC